MSPALGELIEIDPNVVDTYGVPVLRFHMTHGENEFALLRDGTDTAAQILETVGAKNVKRRYQPDVPGRIRHEVGVARMGRGPKKSVLNQFQQSHEVKNLFIMDGVGFVTNPCQNPTLTIMALCVRSCDYLVGEMKRRNL